jgi:predicted ATPase
MTFIGRLPQVASNNNSRRKDRQASLKSKSSSSGEHQYNNSNSNNNNTSNTFSPTTGNTMIGSHQQAQRNSICSKVSSLTRDSSTRSLDPLKIELADLTRLFGRNEEQEILQAAFVRVLKRDSRHKELVLVRGKPGTGKTALVVDLKDAITSTGTGYFCQGRFRQYQYQATTVSTTHHNHNNNTPYSAMAQALNEVCETIAGGPDRDARRNALYESMGQDRLQELVKLLPKLKNLLHGNNRLYHSGDDDDDDDDEELTPDPTNRSSSPFPTQQQQQQQQKSPMKKKKNQQPPQSPSKQTPQHDPWKDNLHHLHTYFKDFLETLCQPSRPIVMFLDDLQWADTASLNFISNLIGRIETNHFMFVGAYRDDVTQLLPWIYNHKNYNNNNNNNSKKENQPQMTEIELDNLLLQSVDDILSDLTGSQTVSDLAKIVFEKTYGNPFAIFQFLEMLQRKELLVFSFQTHKWVWNLEVIKRKTEVTHNVGHSLVGNIGRLSKETKTVMTLAAVIGLSFDPNILEQIAMHMELLEHEFRQHMSTAMQGIIQDAVSGGLIHPDQMQEIMATQLEFVDEEGSDASLKCSFYEETVQAAVQEAEVEGLISKTPGKPAYKFSHKLVYQAFYERIPQGDEREGLHMRIGKVMRAFYSTRAEDDIFFAAVEHLNIGSAHLETETERINLIGMNQRACQKAKAKSALFSAADFSKKAVELLKVEHDWINHYDLLLSVYNEAAELSYSCGDLDTSVLQCAEILRNGKTLEDKLLALYVRIEVLHAQQKSKEAIESCLTVLTDLGVIFNPNPSWRRLFMEFRRVKRLVNSVGDEGLLAMPSMADPMRVESMKFLSLLATMSYFCSESLLLPMVILRMIKSSIEYGFCDFTPFSLAGYGMLISRVGGKSQDAFNYGALALTLCSRLSNDICIPGTHLVVFTFLDHLRNPLLNGVEPLLRGYQAGISNGELQFAATCMAASAAIGFMCALPLKSYAHDLKHVCEQLKLLKQDIIWTLVAPYRQSALSLVGEMTEDQRLTYKKVFDEKNFLNETGITKAERGLPWHNFFMLSYIVAYIFNDLELAHETRKEMRERNNGGPKSLHFIVYLEVFFSGLVDFARYRKTRKRKCMRKGKEAIRAMEKYVRDGIVNCHGMLRCLQAEHESFRGNTDVVKKLFDDAINTFAAAGSLHFQAVANERAADYFLGAGNNRTWAEAYMGAAIRLYYEWGAVAKAQQLVEENKLGKKKADEAPLVITVRGEESSRRFTPIEGHIEEEFLSSDMLS